MNVILTNLDEPLVNESINRGHITVDELKVWSVLAAAFWFHRKLPMEIPAQRGAQN